MTPVLETISPWKSAWLSMLYCEEGLILTDLHYKPVNLIDRPLLSITRIPRDIFTDMPGFVVKLSAYHAITKPAASLVKHENVPTDHLNPIHHEALDNSKLTRHHL